MKVSDVIEMAKYGELGNLAVKDKNAVILTYINLGMIELYKRFPLRTDELLVTLVEGEEIYDLPANCMRIIAAYGEVPEHSNAVVNVLPVNKADDVRSVNTVGWNKVQIPANIAGDMVSLIYTASPDTIEIEDIEEDIDLPPQLIEALLHYIGYRAHGAVNGNIEGENNTHYQRFEKSCASIIKDGLMTPEDLTMDEKFYSRGFA